MTKRDTEDSGNIIEILSDFLRMVDFDLISIENHRRHGVDISASYYVLSVFSGKS
jgi:hypothetical protein